MNYHSSKRSLFFRCIALILGLCSLGITSAYAASIDKNLSSGKIRIHYDGNSPASCDVIMLGVGTAMGANGYDKLSDQITNYGYIAVILDHNPGNLVKTDANKFRNLANEVKANLLNWIPDSGCNAVAHWIMGGHSAGGQAAQNAVARTPGLADAIFSIDPYNARDTDPVNVPAMYWGFDVTTCFVNKNDAAKEAYNRSQDKRAFYQVKRKYSWGPCGYSPKYFHCSFCDGHCPACTNCMRTPQHFFDDVGLSVDKFVNAAFYGSWSKSALQISTTTPLRLYVDGDQP